MEATATPKGHTMETTKPLAETHLAAVIHAGGGFCRSNPDLILWADPEMNAEGEIVFVDNSAIAWDMDSAWVAR